jgi:hypothetical protein
VIAVIGDVGREECAVAPPEDDLLAPVRGAPIHFHAQLVGLDQPGRLGQPFANLRQEEHEPMRPGAIALERRIGLCGEAALGPASDQCQGFGCVPALRGERSGVGRQEHHHHTNHTSHTDLGRSQGVG